MGYKTKSALRIAERETTRWQRSAVNFEALAKRWEKIGGSGFRLLPE
jgi:hypothetical protein